MRHLAVALIPILLLLGCASSAPSPSAAPSTSFAPAAPTRAPALPTVSAPSVTGFDPTRYVGQGDRYNCGDFTSQAQAQAVLRADPRDPNKLDGDGNGIACESSRAPFDRVKVAR